MSAVAPPRPAVAPAPSRPRPRPRLFVRARVCPECQAIVPNVDGRQNTCIIDRCRGAKPFEHSAPVGMASVRDDTVGGTNLKRESMLLHLVNEIFADGLPKKKDARQRGRGVKKARDGPGRWQLRVLSVVGAMLLLVTCGALLAIIVTLRYARVHLLPYNRKNIIPLSVCKCNISAH